MSEISAERSVATVTAELIPAGTFAAMTGYNQHRAAHWDRVAAAERRRSAFEKAYRRLLTRSFRFLIPEGARVLEIGCGEGSLLADLKPARGLGIDFSPNQIARARSRHPSHSLEFRVAEAHHLIIDEHFDYVVISDVIDDLWDVERFFCNLAEQLNPSTRIVINSYSRLWELPLAAARALGLATPVLRQNWLSPHDIRGIAHLAGLELCNSFADVLLPLDVPWLSGFFNRFLVRLWPFRHLALTNFYVFRPPSQTRGDYTVTVVVPARNEAGHIAAIIDRIPLMGTRTEVIFVEGNSTDDTYETIERELGRRSDIDLKLYKQDGKGKRNAVELGFAQATGDVLMILDADISVLPEDLPKFYRAVADGKGEFINGVRLVYPMEGKAMRPLNLAGNRVFSGLISWIVGQRIQDTLCGTKVLHREQYRAIAANRAYFGDFDPFGDFDLIFGAAKLNLKIVDLPIRYHERMYGTTNIQRWRHGAVLLRMVAFAATKFKFR